MKRPVVVLLLLIANALVSTDRQTTMPERDPGRPVQEWLIASNAADEAAPRNSAAKRSSGSARAARAGDGALVIANFAAVHKHPCFGGAPKQAREARALPRW